MFAFIKNNKISVLSPILIDWDFEKIIEFDPSKIQNPYFDGSQIIEAPKIETETEKFERIFAYLANPTNPLTKEKLEGIEFNDEQIGNLILARVFDNNPHGQTALQTKVIAMLMAKKENPELLAEIVQKMEKINEIRLFFGLSAIKF